MKEFQSQGYIHHNVAPLAVEPPSTFELEIVEQLRALAARLTSGELHVSHFSISVNKQSQRIEIEAG